MFLCLVHYYLHRKQTTKRKENIMNTQTQIIAAKAIRKAFNATQRELLTETFWDDENLVRKVREMQAQHQVFCDLVAEIKAADKELYEKEFIG